MNNISTLQSLKHTSENPFAANILISHGTATIRALGSAVELNINLHIDIFLTLERVEGHIMHPLAGL